MMDRGITVAEQKLAEKLVLLNRRGQGMLTRIYNIKKACSDPKSRPAFLSDKTLEPAIKVLLKKFPSVENSRAPHMSGVLNMHSEIVKGLTNYYYTFVDVMDFKDHAREVLTSIDANFVHFDITLNFHLTKGYFDLIVTYASLFLMIARVEDRKAVLSLFNHAYEVQKGHGETSFPRLGQMIIEYEQPFKKLAEEFTTHAQRVGIALQKLNLIYQRRYLAGDQMRQAQILSLTNMPQNMLNPAQSEQVQCEYLSVEVMSKWLIFGYMLCPSQLTALPGAIDVWKTVLQDGYCITLYRDETILIHKEITTFFDSQKGFSKKKKDVEECLNLAITNSASFHRGRRQYLRMAMQELIHILGDQPGLLGPKALIALLALSLAKDEIRWLVRHNCQNPPKGKKVNADDFNDSQLPHLLFCVIDLRDLFLRYSQVVQRYFVQYLSGFDVAVLKEVIQKISVCPEDESLIMTSFVETLSVANVKQVELGEPFDFQGLRLDWMRLQAYTSVRGSVPELKDTGDLPTLMNSICLHTELVDCQVELLNEVSDLSLLCFYPNFFESTFLACLENPQQMRFATAYPVICTHFLNCTHDLCPEERHPIGDRSLTAVNSFIDAIAFKATHFLGLLCEDRWKLVKQLDAGLALPWYITDDNFKGKNKRRMVQNKKPGHESKKKTIEEVTPMEVKYQGQMDLLVAMTHSKDVKVWEHVFSPKEYLVSHLEEFFSKTVVKLANYSEAAQEIARPTQLLRNIKAYMGTLHRLEETVNLDMGRIFNATLLQQTQSCDNSGGPTLTSIYTAWYNDVFLKRITSIGGVSYSPARQSFVSKGKAQHKAEDYTDISEMRALAELLGAYGVKFFCRKMMNQIAAQVEELKKLILLNKEVLLDIKKCINEPDQSLDRRLRNVDDVLARTTIIGVILCFRSLLMNGLKHVLPQRAPYLMKVLIDFKEHNPRNDLTLTHEMAQAAGVETEFDAELFHSLRNNREEEDSNLWTLLLVYWAATLPTLACKETSEYNQTLQAHENNAHCMSKAINALCQALFTITEQPVEEKMREFLALASCNMLRLGMDIPTSKEFIPRQRESVYVLLDIIVHDSPYLTADDFDQCFPYSLIREAYHSIYKKHRVHHSQTINVRSEQETG